MGVNHSTVASLVRQNESLREINRQQAEMISELTYVASWFFRIVKDNFTNFDLCDFILYTGQSDKIHLVIRPSSCGRRCN